MTDCSRDSLTFSRLGAKAVVADFQGGRLTTDAGALLLRQVERRLGLFDALDAAIPDPRRPELIEHDQKALLAQRITAIALGYEDLNDHHTLRADPALQVVAGRDPAPAETLASPSTLCRLENRVDRAAAVRIAAVLVEQFVAGHAEPPEALTLDFDATDDPIHGKQEGRFFHGYYDQHCFLPLYVFCGDELLVAYLRPSNIDAAKHSRAILKLLVQRLRAAWPEVKITIRADSGFCRWRLMRWCDSNGVGYVIGLARNARLLALAGPWLHAAATCWGRTGQPQRLFGEFHYAAGPWDRCRRVIVKAEHNAQGDNPRFIVSNLPGNARGLYDVLYCQRGEAENRIKEQQGMLFAGRTSCHAFLSNQFRLLLSAAAYVLVEAIRRLGLGGTPLEQAQVNTIRLRLLKVAAVVTLSVRRVYLRMASGYPLQTLFALVLQRLSSAAPLAGSASG
jgi:hypothetical protein